MTINWHVFSNLRFTHLHKILAVPAKFTNKITIRKYKVNSNDTNKRLVIKCEITRTNQHLLKLQNNLLYQRRVHFESWVNGLDKYVFNKVYVWRNYTMMLQDFEKKNIYLFYFIYVVALGWNFKLNIYRTGFSISELWKALFF